MNNDQIREMLRYHAPDDSQRETFENTRKVMLDATLDIAGRIPNSRERSLFLTHMQQAQMFANAAVAIHGPRDRQ